MPTSEAPRPLRCAIYTRKSTEEGLAQEFNSLDAQRECAEAYIQSQRQQGWTSLPEHYDDGGYTGANLDRPALQHLLADVDAGKIDCIVVYKVDRLSRSLFDFARLMQIFEQRGISFVSVTQQLNSSAPMGRLTLNVLLSFAQFERELISERTRDKKSAARKKGKWMGGYLPLGYDVEPNSARLRVNETEAKQVRQIFQRFLRTGSLIATLEECHERVWRMKSWTTKHGKFHPGQPFDRTALKRLLSNPLYAGNVSHEGKIYPGEQAAIVDSSVWRGVHRLLQRTTRDDKPRNRRRQQALLNGRLVCAGCGKRIVAGFTTKRGRRYPYYTCPTAQRRGAKQCPGRLVSGPRIEDAVVRAIFQVAADCQSKDLRRIVPVDRQQWERLPRSEQRSVLETMVEKITYDRQLQMGKLRLRPDVARQEPEEIVIDVRKKPLTQQHSPGPAEETEGPRPEQRLPRITRLLALAVRMENLLQQGIARDYADLARLGGVSRARITQIMNLRNLAPAIQERILLHPPTSTSPARINENVLRRLTGCLHWRQQMQLIGRIWPEASTP